MGTLVLDREQDVMLWRKWDMATECRLIHRRARNEKKEIMTFER